MDHDRINITASNISCGVTQLSRISEETDAAIFAVANYCNHPSRGQPAAFFLASDVSNVETATSRFMDEITKKGLGDVTVSRPEINPKTSNPIQVWTWTPDHRKLKDFYLEVKIQKLKSKL
jgi:hypothetical protein